MNKRNNKKLSNELINLIRNFYNEGNSCQVTAEKFGVGKTTVKSYVDIREKKLLTKEERKRNAVNSVVKRKQKLKGLAIEYKGGKCVKCGYDKYNGALQFHHLNPEEKDFSFSDGGYSLSWLKIIKELDKCILVCANCHSEIHGGIIQVEIS
jgi:predicted DNA-binding protein YlxM (UPF0122 family)